MNDKEWLIDCYKDECNSKRHRIKEKIVGYKTQVRSLNKLLKIEEEALVNLENEVVILEEIEEALSMDKE